MEFCFRFRAVTESQRGLQKAECFEFGWNCFLYTQSRLYSSISSWFGFSCTTYGLTPPTKCNSHKEVSHCHQEDHVAKLERRRSRSAGAGDCHDLTMTLSAQSMHSVHPHFFGYTVAFLCMFFIDSTHKSRQLPFNGLTCRDSLLSMLCPTSYTSGPVTADHVTHYTPAASSVVLYHSLFLIWNPQMLLAVTTIDGHCETNLIASHPFTIREKWAMNNGMTFFKLSLFDSLKQ